MYQDWVITAMGDFPGRTKTMTISEMSVEHALYVFYTKCDIDKSTIRNIMINRVA